MNTTNQETGEGNAPRKHLEYPGICSRCKKPWGDHLTDIALKDHPNACPFVPFEGEINKPTLVP